MHQIDDILRTAMAAGASDIHINSGLPPMFRINTTVVASDFPPVNRDSATQLARGMMNDKRWAELSEHRDLDFSYQLPGTGRFRVNAHFQRDTVALSVRVIHPTIRPLEQLFLPAIVEQLTELTRGLVLVTGGTGSGKSTTLAGMIDTINKRDRGHIVTLEDPIEFDFVSDQCCIEQRAVGTDVKDFSSGLRHVLRQDPDTILVGEMRDLETTSAALTAAETGHLVLSTLHTNSATQTIDRIIDIYPSNQQNHVRTMLAGSLSAVISQSLFKRADRPGMIPAVEVLICNNAVRNCIRENRVFEIQNLIETNKSAGMQSMDSSIKQLLKNGFISTEDALAGAAQPERLRNALAA